MSDSVRYKDRAAFYYHIKRNKRKAYQCHACKETTHEIRLVGKGRRRQYICTFCLQRKANIA
jgi:predicted SprT family Zn-dependent metalloprotease